THSCARPTQGNGEGGEEEDNACFCFHLLGGGCFSDYFFCVFLVNVYFSIFPNVVKAIVATAVKPVL
ncbi:MAG: hypothetical protein ACR2H1_03250, partial [Limisphaerales bacterium]